MKKKIGEIYNKPIVVGNKNKITKNEIHVDEISNVKQNEEGGEQNKMRYFSLRAPSFDAVYCSTLAKYQVDGSTLIGPTLMYAEESESIEGANSCIIAAAFNFNTKIRIGDNVYNNLFELYGISSVEEFIDRFTIEEEITEEQFYDPDFNPFE